MNKCKLPQRNCHYSTEIALFIECCSSTCDSAKLETLSQQITQWERFTQTASRHGILPLVHHALKVISSVPDEIKERLKSLNLEISMRNMAMSAELIRIMKLLEDHNIEALAFKGPALAQMAYGDITLRQYVDLDILVDETDAYRAGTLMSQHGHKPLLPLTILAKQTCLDTAKDFSLISVKNTIHTELHWRLFEKRYRLRLFSQQTSIQYVSINGHSIPTLPKELLLVYLCMHGAKHTFERLEWICDIDRLLRTAQIDWDEAIRITSQSRSKRSFLLGLHLAHTLFDTPISATVLVESEQSVIEALQATVIARLHENKTPQSDFAKNKATFYYQSRLFDHSADTLRFWLSTLFGISVNDCQTFRLPTYLKPLYLFLRPARLLWSYGKKMFTRRD